MLEFSGEVNMNCLCISEELTRFVAVYNIYLYIVAFMFLPFSIN